MNLLLKILKGRCPNCAKGDIFCTSGSIFLFKMPKMPERCKICNYKFEKETGFFFGAMYVSYALAAGEMIMVLVLGWYIVSLEPLSVFAIITLVIILTSAINFRLSRIIWIYLCHEKN